MGHVITANLECAESMSQRCAGASRYSFTNIRGFSNQRQFCMLMFTNFYDEKYSFPWSNITAALK